MKGYLIMIRAPGYGDGKFSKHGGHRDLFMQYSDFGCGEIYLTEEDLTHPNVVMKLEISNIDKFKEFLFSNCYDSRRDGRSYKSCTGCSVGNPLYYENTALGCQQYIGRVMKANIDYVQIIHGIRLENDNQIIYVNQPSTYNFDFNTIEDIWYRDGCPPAYNLQQTLDDKNIDKVNNMLLDLSAADHVHKNKPVGSIQRDERFYLTRIWFMNDVVSKYNKSRARDRDIIESKIAKLKLKYPIDYTKPEKKIKSQIFEYATENDIAMEECYEDIKYLCEYFDDIVEIPTVTATPVKE